MPAFRLDVSDVPVPFSFVAGIRRGQPSWAAFGRSMEVFPRYGPDFLRDCTVVAEFVALFVQSIFFKSNILITNENRFENQHYS